MGFFYVFLLPSHTIWGCFQLSKTGSTEQTCSLAHCVSDAVSMILSHKSFVNFWLSNSSIMCNFQDRTLSLPDDFLYLVTTMHWPHWKPAIANYFPFASAFKTGLHFSLLSDVQYLLSWPICNNFTFCLPRQAGDLSPGSLPQLPRYMLWFFQAYRNYCDVVQKSHHMVQWFVCHTMELFKNLVHELSAWKLASVWKGVASVWAWCSCTWRLLRMVCKSYY